MSWSLKKKLYAAFGTIIFLVAVLGTVVLLRMREAEHLATEEARYQNIALDSERMYTHLIQARRHEKDFFERGADVNAEQLHKQSKADFERVVTSMRGLLTPADGALTKRLDEVADGYGKYESLFNEAAETFRKRGQPDNGVQGDWRAAAHEVERISGDLDDKLLTIQVLQLRRHEKDYLNREDPKYVDEFRQTMDVAKRHVGGGKENESVRARLLDLLGIYEAKFESGFELTKELEGKKTAMHAATDANEADLAELVKLASERAQSADAESTSVQHTSELILVGVFVLALGVALLVARLISSQITVAVGVLAVGARSIGGGDLRTRVQVAGGDELAELGGSFNQMVVSLRDMASNITTATGSMEQIVTELQSTVAEQAAALQQQASSVSETVATSDELARSSEQVSEVARRVLDEAGRSVETSKRGLDAIQQSIAGMSDVRDQVQNIATTILDLSEKTQQIGSIIATVDDFAERSSLLALNASIEAARAGEAGKAFSVVAGEVKNLAEQSQQATEKVRGILNDIQRTTHTAVMVTEEGSKRVDRGVELVTGAGEIIDTLSSAITSAADSAKQIAAAARQQSNGIEQISAAMAGIEQFSRQNVEATKQTETTTHTLAAISKQLRSSSAQYQV